MRTPPCSLYQVINEFSRQIATHIIRRSRRTSAVVALAALLISGPLAAQDKIPPMPEGDTRVYIAGATMNSDRLMVGAPYNYGEIQSEFDYLYEMAEWGCNLYGRTAVLVSWNSSLLECDEMGQAAAERDPKCEHQYHFACAIKR